MSNVNFGSNAYGGPNSQYLALNSGFKVGVSQEDLMKHNPLKNEAFYNLNQS